MTYTRAERDVYENACLNARADFLLAHSDKIAAATSAYKRINDEIFAYSHTAAERALREYRATKHLAQQGSNQP